MLTRIKKRLDAQLPRFLDKLNDSFHLTRISPLLYSSIKEFVLRDGKRVRPILFVSGYLGFTRRPAPGLYTSALSIELLHDFMLVHDDIIDKSDLRRGKPSMHTLYNRYLRRNPNSKFSGQDLAIVSGDVMYAMAIHAFLTIEEEMARKERALRKFIEAAVYTGCGEFIELLEGLKEIDRVAKDDIYAIYDYKTAFYTFACPLASGAILAGAPQSSVDKLTLYGQCVGRAFQIKDDIIGMVCEEKTSGKSNLSDLREGKRTLLIWYAYQRGGRTQKKLIKNILTKKNAGMTDLLRMRKVITETGALTCAREEMESLRKKAQANLAASGLKPAYAACLNQYAQAILQI